MVSFMFITVIMLFVVYHGVHSRVYFVYHGDHGKIMFNHCDHAEIFFDVYYYGDDGDVYMVLHGDDGKILLLFYHGAYCKLSVYHDDYDNVHFLQHHNYSDVRFACDVYFGCFGNYNETYVDYHLLESYCCSWMILILNFWVIDDKGYPTSHASICFVFDHKHHDYCDKRKSHHDHGDKT